MDDLGHIAVGGLVRIEWNTTDLSGDPATRTPGTIRIYKDDGTTPRASAVGVTDTADFGSKVGKNRVSIDLSSNADPGFYAEGSEYFVEDDGAIVEGITYTLTLARFKIGVAPADVTEVAGTPVSGVADFKATGFSTHSAADAATATRAELAVELARLDADVSSRSTFAGGAVASVTGNVGGNVVGSVGSVTGAVGSVTAAVTVGTNNDKTGYSLAGTLASLDSLWAKILGAFRLSLRKDAAIATDEATVLAEINANVASGAGAYANTTDAQEAGADAALTAAGVRTELATELGRIDATVSSRLASASYTAPPSAAANATAVRTELATELGRLDAAVTTRLAAADYAAAPTAAANATAVRTELATELARVDAAVSTRSSHSAAGAATAVRTELATELSRVDAAVSSRLASASYAAAPTAAANATAVRTELATELARIDVAVSSVDGGGGALTGPYALTITVTDSVTSAAIESAKVRVKLNSDQESALTNASGQVAPLVDDGTWEVRVRRYGYDSVTTSKVVAGADATLSVPLTAWIIDPPESAEDVTGVLLIEDEETGEPSVGTVVTVQFTQGPPGSGLGIGGEAEKTDTSDASGLIQIQHTRGAYYRYKIGSGPWSREYLAPTTGDSFNIPNHSS